MSMGGRANGRQDLGRPRHEAASGARGAQLAKQAAAAGLLVSEAGSVPSSTARGLSTAGDESRDAISASSSRASSSALRQRGSTVVGRQGGGGDGGIGVRWVGSCVRACAL